MGYHKVTPYQPSAMGHGDCRPEAREVPVLVVTSTAAYTKIDVHGSQSYCWSQALSVLILRSSQKIYHLLREIELWKQYGVMMLVTTGSLCVTSELLEAKSK